MMMSPDIGQHDSLSETRCQFSRFSPHHNIEGPIPASDSANSLPAVSSRIKRYVTRLGGIHFLHTISKSVSSGPCLKPSFSGMAHPSRNVVMDVEVDMLPEAFPAWTSSNQTAIYCNIVLTTILVYDSSERRVIVLK